jgi:hypothetical protein
MYLDRCPGSFTFEGSTDLYGAILLDHASREHRSSGSELIDGGEEGIKGTTIVRFDGERY